MYSCVLFMAQNGLSRAHVPLRNYSLTRDHGLGLENCGLGLCLEELGLGLGLEVCDLGLGLELTLFSFYFTLLFLADLDVLHPVLVLNLKFSSLRVNSHNDQAVLKTCWLNR